MKDLVRTSSKIHHVPPTNTLLTLRADRCTAELLGELRFEHHDLAAHDRHERVYCADLVFRDSHVISIEDYVVGELAWFERSQLVLSKYRPGSPRGHHLEGGIAINGLL